MFGFGGIELLILIPILGCLALYPLPLIIARKRGHPNVNSIIVVNLLLGWTFIGWVAALVWAVSSFRRDG